MGEPLGFALLGSATARSQELASRLPAASDMTTLTA